MKIRLSSLRKIIREEVSRSLSEATRSPVNLERDLASLPAGGQIEMTVFDDMGGVLTGVAAKRPATPRELMSYDMDPDEGGFYYTLTVDGEVAGEGIDPSALTGALMDKGWEFSY